MIQQFRHRCNGNPGTNVGKARGIESTLRKGFARQALLLIVPRAGRLHACDEPRESLQSLRKYHSHRR
jgi:hypothetical protein